MSRHFVLKKQFIEYFTLLLFVKGEPNKLLKSGTQFHFIFSMSRQMNYDQIWTELASAGLNFVNIYTSTIEDAVREAAPDLFHVYQMEISDQTICRIWNEQLDFSAYPQIIEEFLADLAPIKRSAAISKFYSAQFDDHHPQRPEFIRILRQLVEEGVVSDPLAIEMTK